MSDSSKDENSKGEDPNLQGPADVSKVKMTGDGAPGSHSAVFGLTPDGKTYNDTTKGSGVSKPVHSEETAIGGGTAAKDDTDASRATTGSGVADQMNDPRVAEKGHEGRAVESTGGAGDKPGAGVGLVPSQGTGEVGKDA